MTCREKLAKEHPEQVDSGWLGGCHGCPMNYDYLPKPEYCELGSSRECNRCWDREIPGTEESNYDIPWDKIREMIDDAMAKRDRTISLYFNPDTGFSLNVYPWPDADELYEQYRKGRITANDFREKMGLARVKNAEQFMSKE